MIKEIEENNTIKDFVKELTLQISDLKKKDWKKKFVCTKENIYFIKSKYTNRKNEFVEYEKTNDIIKIAIELMNKNGLKHINSTNTIDNTSVEFHYANSDDEYVYPWSSIHKDNDNGILVNTLIYYFDVDCEGGEIVFYELDEKTIVSKIESKLLNKKILIFSGDIFHNPLKMKNGHRYALSFHIPI